MTTIRVAGALTASDVAARTLTYRLLPFGEPGRTSIGLVTASAGAVELPTDPGSIVLNVEHEPTRPVGVATSIVETATELLATFRILPTSAGDDLLVEAGERVRPGVSVELDNVVVRGGALVAGRLTGAGAVVAPAFPSALLVASDTPDDLPVVETPDPVDPDEETEGDPVPDTETPAATAAPAAAPAALVATATPPAPAMTLPRVSRLLAQLGRGDRSPELLAALADITYGDNPAVSAPAFIGEVWQGSQYERQIVPLIGRDTLTSYKVVGWKWNGPAPVGAEYAGNKAAVPSAVFETTPAEYEAQRWAGAHDVDRKFRDFGDESFWTSYWRAMAASYAKWSDAECAAGLLAGATAATPAGTGVVAAIVAAALAVIPNGTPTFTLLGESAFAELVERDPLAFLSGQISLANGNGNVGGLTFIASAALAADQVLVGNRNAATWYELGETPIRVEAVNVANGGIDVGSFGYGVVGVHSGLGLAKATIDTTP